MQCLLLLILLESSKSTAYLAQGVDLQVGWLLVLPFVKPDHLHIHWQAMLPARAGKMLENGACVAHGTSRVHCKDSKNAHLVTV